MHAYHGGVGSASRLPNTSPYHLNHGSSASTPQYLVSEKRNFSPSGHNATNLLRILAGCWLRQRYAISDFYFLSFPKSTHLAYDSDVSPLPESSTLGAFVLFLATDEFSPLKNSCNPYHT
jgi:hypothetical protein